MYMRDLLRYSIVFLITLALSYALLYTGIWALTTIAGLVATVAFSREYLKAAISSFIGGTTSSGLFLYLNYAVFGGPVLEVAYYAGAVAGIPGYTFLLLTFLLTGIYCVIGSIIGVFIRKIIHKH
jgi:hypothetical protein